MNCNIVKDLIPLYIDGCCSEESSKMIEAHMKDCADCKKLFDDMQSPCDMVTVSTSPTAFKKLNDWKASVLQSVLLFLSFALVTIGVALEAQTPSGTGNGFWALNLIIPATGFMLSLANWYFVSVYQSRKIFSNCSLVATLGITLIAYVWSVFHYGADRFENLLAGLLLTILFCTLSKILSNQYAKMLGKE